MAAWAPRRSMASRRDRSSDVAPAMANLPLLTSTATLAAPPWSVTSASPTLDRLPAAAS